MAQVLGAPLPPRQTQGTFQAPGFSLPRQLAVTGIQGVNQQKEDLPPWFLSLSVSLPQRDCSRNQKTQAWADLRSITP